MLSKYRFINYLFKKNKNYIVAEDALKGGVSVFSNEKIEPNCKIPHINGMIIEEYQECEVLHSGIMVNKTNAVLLGKHICCGD